jgi:hypothetical protein
VAQVVWMVAEICFAPDAMGKAWSPGARGVVEPSPSWPRLLPPQHCTAPAVVRTQVCFQPAAIAATGAPSETSIGRALFVPVLEPSWP